MVWLSWPIWVLTTNGHDSLHMSRTQFLYSVRVPDIHVSLGRGSRTCLNLEPKSHIPCNYLGPAVDCDPTMSPTIVLTGLCIQSFGGGRTARENVINPGFSKGLTVYSNYTSCICVHMPLCACMEGPEVNLKCYSSGAIHLVF